ncbi:MAG TPA: glycosyltransferase N-terminal domain-containing protein [Chitinophagaceae bacterium]|nr:glycosyltransferase N-terminal domain-containing protein [Chitinophagaceae bacterium]
MSVFFYNIFLLLFKAATHLAALFDGKAKKWVNGRKNIFKKLQETIPRNEKIVWVHCASLGEFEQGRPVIEKLRTLGTGHRILLTFFSPSGYEVQKNYTGADWVFYLPADGARNAKRFLEIVNPALVIFVKYEFWYYYLKKIKYREIPLLLVSALFRPDMSFFKWYGGLQRKMLSRFDHLFVQNEESKKLIARIGLDGICSVSGDTRFDRVIRISEQFEPIPSIEKFIGESKVLVAGSTWKEDEEVLQKAFASFSESSLKLIIAPHEITEAHLDDLKKLFPYAILYSQPAWRQAGSPLTVLIIDNIGMLSRLYKYGSIAYVGGGLKPMGVHNVLEAAVYGKPVIVGPFYEKYVEARELVGSGGALVINNEVELANTITNLINNSHGCYDKASGASKDYVWKNKGATEKITRYIQEKRLLTS